MANTYTVAEKRPATTRPIRTENSIPDFGEKILFTMVVVNEFFLKKISMKKLFTCNGSPSLPTAMIKITLVTISLFYHKLLLSTLIEIVKSVDNFVFIFRHCELQRSNLIDLQRLLRRCGSSQ